MIMNMIALITTYTLKTTTIAMKTIRIRILTTDSMTMVLTEIKRKFKTMAAISAASVQKWLAMEK